MTEKILRMAVIGVKNFGISHARAIAKSKNACLVKVCDIDEETAEKASQELEVPYCTDYTEILSDPEIDAISIATPDQLHVKISTEALEAGKHVLCEKPLALELAECKKMVAVAEKSDKKMMVGQIARYTPSFIKAKECIDNGEIGEIFFAESEYAHDYAEINTPWRLDPKRHPMIGGACHAIDLLRWIVGDPEEVAAFSNHYMLPKWPTDDCTISILKFKNGAIGKILCSTGCKRRYTMRTVIYGSEGTVIVDNTSDTMSVFKSKIAESDKFIGEKTQTLEIKIPVAVNNHNVENELADFLNIVLENIDIGINAREGAKTVAVAEAIINSAQYHSFQKVDYNF